MRTGFQVRLAGILIVAFATACGTPSQPEVQDGIDDEPTGGDSVAADNDDEMASEKGQVRVGMLLPFTGLFAGPGEDVNDGFSLYLEEQGGRLAGWQIDVIRADDASDPAVATEVTQRLIERDEVDIVAGVLLSSIGAAVGPLLADSGIPTLITVAGANDLTQRNDADTVFRMMPSSSQYTHALGDYLCVEEQYQRAAIVALDYEFGWESMGGFARVYKDAGCEVVQELYVPLGTEDWAPFVNQIDDSADIVVTTLTGPDTVRFLQAYHDFGLAGRIPLAGSGGTTDPSNLAQSEHQALAEGIISTMHFSEAVGTPASQAFQEAFEAAHGRPAGVYAEAGYAAAMMLEAALGHVDELTPEGLVEALASSQVDDAPRGSGITFDEYGQMIGDIYVRKMEEVDGQWKNTVIHTYPDTTQFWNYEASEYLSLPTYVELRGTWADGG